MKKKYGSFEDEWMIALNNYYFHDEEEINIDNTKKIPKVIIPKDFNKMYALLLIDPDAPRPDYLHWLVINISNNNKDIIVKYQPPNPPSGTHRYYFYLLEQKNEIHVPQPDRIYFNLEHFIKQYGLKIIKSKMFKTKQNYLSLI